jgi:2-C-methyl-D-erythritol 4-phosphate cytidylyltransferase
MREKTYAIITAGGLGARFAKSSASAKPKQFLNLLGKPVILYSMLVFQKCREVDEIIISADKGYFDYIHQLAAKHRINKLTRMVEGGKTRFTSVKNAFMSIDNPGKNDLVIIHDAARPNINTGLVSDMLNESCEVITGCRITETVKRDKAGYITDTLNRENLWLVQTPQVFRYDVLSNSYKKRGRKNDFTDEASLVEYAGYKIKITEGLKDNIKITTPGDFALLKKIMK